MSSMTKLYIRETHNKHAGPYTCAARDQLQQTVAHTTIRLLLYSTTSSFSITRLYAARHIGRITGLVFPSVRPSVRLSCLSRMGS